MRIVSREAATKMLRSVQKGDTLVFDQAHTAPQPTPCGIYCPCVPIPQQPQQQQQSAPGQQQQLPPGQLQPPPQHPQQPQQQQQLAPGQQQQSAPSQPPIPQQQQQQPVPGQQAPLSPLSSSRDSSRCESKEKGPCGTLIDMFKFLW